MPRSPLRASSELRWARVCRRRAHSWRGLASRARLPFPEQTISGREDNHDLQDSSRKLLGLVRCAVFCCARNSLVLARNSRSGNRTEEASGLSGSRRGNRGRLHYSGSSRTHSTQRSAEVPEVRQETQELYKGLLNRRDHLQEMRGDVYGEKGANGKGSGST